MLTFNTILSHEKIDPREVRLVRHQDNRASVSCTPYNLWRAKDGRLETYQRIQRREVFEVGGLLATFVVTPRDETLFIGLYQVDAIGIAPPGTVDPVVQEERAGLHFYDIHRETRLSEYEGHLLVNSGSGT